MKNTFLPIAIIIASVIISGTILYSRSNSSTAAFNGTNNVAPQVKSEISISDTDPSLGNPEAPVTIVAFEDFECFFCQRFTQQTKPQLQKDINEGRVRLVWKDFPLSIHPHAQKAHEAGRCAFEQGKFWEYHDVLFENQTKLSIKDLKSYAKNLALDSQKFDACLDSSKYASLVKEKVNEGIAAGVTGTPSFFINGNIIVGAQPYQAFADATSKALNK